jgi:hypothetical protein
MVKASSQFMVLKSHSNRIKHLKDVNKVLIVSKWNRRHIVEMPTSIMAAVETLRLIQEADRANPYVPPSQPARKATQLAIQF